MAIQKFVSVLIDVKNTNNEVEKFFIPIVNEIQGQLPNYKPFVSYQRCSGVIWFNYKTKKEQKVIIEILTKQNVTIIDETGWLDKKANVLWIAASFDAGEYSKLMYYSYKEGKWILYPGN